MSEHASRAAVGSLLWQGMLLLLVATFGVVAPAAAQTVDISLADPAAPSDQDVLLQALVETEVASPVQLRLLRMTLQPGARSPWHAHPGLEFGVVEQGTLRVQVEGPAVLRPADATPDAASQSLPENLDISLSAGDRIAYAPGTAMTFENPGTEPTVLLAATVFPADVEPASYTNGQPTDDDMSGIESVVIGQALVPRVSTNSVVVLERLAVESGQNVPAFTGPVLMSLESGAVAGTVQAAAVSSPGDSTVTEGDEVDFSLGQGQAAFFSNGMSQAPLGGGGGIKLLRLGLLPGATPAGAATPGVTVTSVPPTEAAPTAAVATIGPPPNNEPAASQPAADPTPTSQPGGRPLFAETPVGTATPTQQPIRTITQQPTPTPAGDAPAADEPAEVQAEIPAAESAVAEETEPQREPAGEEAAEIDAGLYPPPGTRLVVNDTDVRIRAEPSTSGQILGGLTTGQGVVVLDLPTAADGYIWYPVQVEDDPSLSGWVAAEFLSAAGP